MKNKWRILKIAVTAILFGFLLSFSLKRFNNTDVKNVAVNLKQAKNPVYFIDEKDMVQLVKKSNPTNRIGDLDIPTLERQVNAIPAVDSANVYLNLNGGLTVDVLQKVPAFRLNTKGKDFYVDTKGREFPIYKNYSHPSMLVTGNIKPSEYKKLVVLVDKINADEFNRKYFIGITKNGNDYNLITSEGNFKVELGDLERLDFKLKGFKTFVEKFLIYQNPDKYTKISVKYNNQIVTSLNPNFTENDSILQIGNRELQKLNINQKTQ